MTIDNFVPRKEFGEGRVWINNNNGSELGEQKVFKL